MSLKASYTLEETARILRVSLSAVKKWARGNLLPTFRLPGRAGRRVTAQALEAIMGEGLPQESDVAVLVQHSRKIKGRR